jgi:hypothetical protein
MTEDRRESVAILRNVKYRITALYHDLVQDEDTQVKHLDDLKHQIDELKTVQFHMENEIAERNDPVEARNLLQRAQDAFNLLPSANNYRAVERAQLAYQAAFMARLESHS